MSTIECLHTKHLLLLFVYQFDQKEEFRDVAKFICDFFKHAGEEKAINGDLVTSVFPRELREGDEFSSYNCILICDLMEVAVSSLRHDLSNFVSQEDRGEISREILRDVLMFIIGRLRLNIGNLFADHF